MGIKHLVLLSGILLMTSSCQVDRVKLKENNDQLQKKVDSLKNELYECNMMMEAYEGLPLGV